MWIFLFFIFFLNSLTASDYSIVYVHIGPKLPVYTETAIKQARLFNPNCPIILIANQQALDKYEGDSITQIPIETLKQTKEHKQFLTKCKYGPGLWSYSSERFLLLYDLVSQYDVGTFFHMENDIMLYTNLEQLLPTLRKNYQGIGATFDNDDRCIPGFVYVPNKQAMYFLAKFFANNFQENSTDMSMIAKFKNERSDRYVKPLPIIFPHYKNFFPLVSPSGHIAKKPESYSLHFDEFNSIFDAAALGQYIGGIDPQHFSNGPGFINESCVFNPGKMNYEWIEDSLGRKIPYMKFNGESYKINNLHIHCKNLKKFAS